MLMEPRTEFIFKRLQKMLVALMICAVAIFIGLTSRVQAADVKTLASTAASQQKGGEITLELPIDQDIHNDKQNTKYIYSITKEEIVEALKARSAAEVLTIKPASDNSLSTYALRIEADTIRYILEEHPELILQFHSSWLSYRLPVVEFEVEELVSLLNTSTDSLAFMIEFGKIDGSVEQNLTDVVRSIGGTLQYSPVFFNVLAEITSEKSNGRLQTELIILRDLPGQLLLPSATANNVDLDKTTIVRINLNHSSAQTVHPVYLLPVLSTTMKDIEGIVIPRAIGNYVYLMMNYDKTFKDTIDLPEQEAIETLASKLIFSGRDLDKFAPNDHLTQAEMAALVVRIKGIEGRYYPLEKIRKLAADAFDDVSVDDWFAVYAGSLYYTGQIPVGSFNAYSLATLEQLNQLLFSPHEEADWNVSEEAAESTLLTRAAAAKVMFEYYTQWPLHENP